MWLKIVKKPICRSLDKTQVIFIAFLLMISSCESLQPQRVRDLSSLDEMQNILNDSKRNNQELNQPLPDDIFNALLPPLSLMNDPVNKVTDVERFDLYVDKLPAKDFFVGLVEGTDLNMVVHPNVKGDITLKLKNVTVDEVMSVARDVYGYEFKKQNNMYQVLPAGLYTRIYQIDYLNLIRSGRSQTRVSAGTVSDAGTSSSGNDDSSDNSSSDNDDSDDSSDSGKSVVGTEIETSTEADFWSELSVSLNMIIGSSEGRSVVATPQAGIVVVSASSSEQQAVREYLEKAQLVLQRQVIIEAKILEVTLSDGFQAGINWTAITELSDGSKSIEFGQSSESIVNADGIGGVFNATFDLSDFTGLVELLETQGTVQVLSTPRISTVNNQKAVIKVGQDEFFVTEVTSTTTTGTATTTIPSVELTPFFSGIALDVTPQISGDNHIILHVHPTISSVEDQTKNIIIGSSLLSLPLALSTIRETDSIIRAKNRQVVVIGGLMKNVSEDVDAKTPWLGDVPILGHLFKQKQQASLKSELVILLQPIIADDESWNEVVERSIEDFSSIKSYTKPREFF